MSRKISDGTGWVFKMNKGDLVGYWNIDNKIEWGIVLSNEPFMYTDNAIDPPYMAVTVIWPDDNLRKTNERLETILSNDERKSGIWLQSSSRAL